VRKTFVISDLHLGHENIIKYCNRPYATIEDMDADFVSAWNSTVGDHDVVYVLGDFCLGRSKQAGEYFKQLRGRVDVFNNFWHHDGRWMQDLDLPTYAWNTVKTKTDQMVLCPPIIVTEEEVPGDYPQATVLCHYPIETWDRKHYGSTHLFGHIHSTDGYIDGSMRLDVGVDNLMHMFDSPAPIELNVANEIILGTSL
jgi:calcineurin-like phosphoesterase family protein